jgi:CheY-like chemotaxis protein
MTTALIADDEDAPREQLAAALARAWPSLRLVAQCRNGADAWDAWLEHEPPVCFLDIRMPGLSGIDVARRIHGRSAVVFVTAFDDHALAAFDAGAVDYVLKPLDPARLSQAVERLRARMNSPVLDPTGLQTLLEGLAGSLRRRKQEVGDIEILYIPTCEVRPVRGDMFATGKVDVVNEAIKSLMERGILKLREGETGHTSYGPKNKLMTHVPSGIPVDFFATVESSWFNYLVCRTGSKENNLRIATAAQDKGWRWNPYGCGFSGPNGKTYQVTAERDVFQFVGLPYLEPKDR